MSDTDMETQQVADQGRMHALEKYLEPYAEYLGDEDVTEVVQQQSGHCFVYKNGRATRIDGGEELDFRHCMMFATVAAGCTGQEISEANPLVSGSIPPGHRIQLAIPPATPQGTAAFAIRRHKDVQAITFEDYVKRGAFKHTRRADRRRKIDANQKLLDLYDADTEAAKIDFIRLAATNRLNFLISGSTDSGKTTFQRVLFDLVPKWRRLITVQDALELVLAHENVVHLLYSRGGRSASKHTAVDLVRAALRMRPDIILVGELRGDPGEVSSYLQAVNTGHPGTVTTVHANGCYEALNQLVNMYTRSSENITQEQARRYVHSVIDVVMHFDSDSQPRFVPVEYLYVPADDLTKC